MADIDLSGFGENLRVAVFGAGGGIGAAFVRHLSRHAAVDTVYSLSRRPMASTDSIKSVRCDTTDENDIEEAVRSMDGPLQLVIVTTGILHDDSLEPEKANSALNGAMMAEVFRINTIAPALVAKHCLPLLDRDRKSVFAALSARVGSISDNRIGGWHSYRASKAALNQVVRTMSIELARKNKQAAIVGLHPGTVDTGLSEPFQKNVPEGKLFAPDYSTERMLGVLNTLGPDDSGWCYDYAGKRIEP